MQQSAPSDSDGAIKHPHNHKQGEPANESKDSLPFEASPTKRAQETENNRDQLEDRSEPTASGMRESDALVEICNEACD